MYTSMQNLYKSHRWVKNFINIYLYVCVFKFFNLIFFKVLKFSLFFHVQYVYYITAYFTHTQKNTFENIYELKK